jgi:hypothetical protein
MKKVLINFCTLAIAALFAGSLFATTVDATLYGVTTSSEDKKMVLNLSGTYGAKATCTILDRAGNTIYKEIVNAKKQKTVRYDFSKLPSGEYTLIVDDIMSVEKVDFKITSQHLLLSTEKSELIYKPTIQVKDSKMIYFNLMSLGKDVKISILKDDRMVYSEIINGQSTISKKLNFLNSPSGEYLIRVDVDKEVFYNTVFL